MTGKTNYKNFIKRLMEEYNLTQIGAESHYDENFNGITENGIIYLEDEIIYQKQKGDDKMFEDLIARVRVYKAKGDMPYQHRPYELTLISDETEVFKDINQDDDRNNISKADFIFHHLSINGVDEDKFDGSESNYNNVKNVEAILLINNNLHIAYSNLQNERISRGRCGWEICGIDLTRAIMYQFTLTDNTIIRFDFQGMIDNEEDTQGIYFQDIIDKNAEAHKRHKQKKRTEKLIEEIMEEEDCIIELSASPLYDNNPKDSFHQDSDLVPNGDFPYMVEFFSTHLVCQDDDDYQGCFSANDYNGKYIRDAMALINDVEKRAKELADKYADKGVKVTVNDFNEGCQYGMAIYVWIPYQ